MLVNAFTNVK